MLSWWLDMEWRVVFPFGLSRTVGEKTGERTATLGSFEEWTKKVWQLLPHNLYHDFHYNYMVWANNTMS